MVHLKRLIVFLNKNKTWVNIQGYSLEDDTLLYSGLTVKEQELRAELKRNIDDLLLT